MTDDDLRQQKQIAAHGAMAGAWIDTRMEFDRSLLALSAGGLGLLSALLRQPAGLLDLTFFVIGVIAFGITLAAMLTTFALNSRAIEDALDGGTGEVPAIKKIGRAAVITFGFGAVATISLAVAAATGRRDDMDRKAKISTTRVAEKQNQRLGLNGIGKALGTAQKGESKVDSGKAESTKVESGESEGAKVESGKPKAKAETKNP